MQGIHSLTRLYHNNIEKSTVTRKGLLEKLKIRLDEYRKETGYGSISIIRVATLVKRNPALDDLDELRYFVEDMKISKVNYCLFAKK